jgi:hypothetical protein
MLLNLLKGEMMKLFVEYPYEPDLSSYFFLGEYYIQYHYCPIKTEINPLASLKH